MNEVFTEFKNLFEERYNRVSVLNMGEDSIRYDFFSALQKVKCLEPWSLQLEYPVHENSFIKRNTVGSKRNEKPQIDLWVHEPHLNLCAEFGMFRRNSQDNSPIAVTENTIKMLNDFVRLGLQAYHTGCHAYFVCIADAKMLNYQLLKVQHIPAFPGLEYHLDGSIVDALMLQYKSSKKFDLRFIDRKKELLMSLKASLVFREEVKSVLNPLSTLALVWEITSRIEKV